MKETLKEELESPVSGTYDVIVAGGGPAGIAAAISAARKGARTALFEVGGCLGGVWTSGLLTWIFESDQPGLPREIRDELERRNARVVGRITDKYVYDVEVMKLLLDEMCLEAGVEVHLHTRVVTAVREGERRLKAVVTESKSGRQAWMSHVFIDCTGDGDLGAQAGNSFDYGDERTGQTQPMTFMAMVNVEDAEAIQECISFYNGEVGPGVHERTYKKFYGVLKEAGVEPSYGRPTLFHVKGHLVAFMANHEYGVCGFNETDVTSATIRARKEVHTLVQALDRLGGAWKGIQIVGTADQIGIRDGRRLHGRYRVRLQDLIDGAQHEDAVAHCKFAVDVHSFTKQLNKDQEGLSHYGVKVKPYDIPVGAIIAKDVDGLLMAGRCISGDYLAHASYRVTGVSVMLGQSAGILGAVSAAAGKLPHELEWKAIRHHFHATERV